ncbi:50S ribosomal protein L22 [Helicobacter sp. NHP19-003]|uniref:50S ribosomal protein L22 n=1 Tax=Helicobacter gastrocanis TaxID=2849641 RepID=A0ABN6I416_9HELI|nr:hypothetical protein [Helicobacter sp. NHP19-003]BCZ17502.1 50S ribosomal protein L22 [Helicobacter sp. NHP19-003]
MEIKENLTQVKEEFKSDEKLLESAFRLEKFYNKYKYVLWALVVLALAWWGYTELKAVQKDKKTQEITAIYNEVLANPNNTAPLEKLQEQAPELAELYNYAQALKNKDTKTLDSLSHAKNPIVKALASYYAASYGRDLKALKALNLPALQDFIHLQQAYLLHNDPKAAQEIKALIATIPPTSGVYPIASLLKHYPATGTQKAAQ